LRLRLCLRRLCLRLRRRWTVNKKLMSLLDGLKYQAARIGLVLHPASNGAPSPGTYHFLRANDDEKTRIHLRIEVDGRGLLLVNAAKIYHLNPTATAMAYQALQQKSNSETIAQLTHSFHVSRAQAEGDYLSFLRQFEELIRPDGACPICDLELEIIAPFSRQPSAPYRMDLAITYRCNNNCAHCYNARPRQYPELDTAKWKKIIDRLWEEGIPHIVFTGGEPTLRPDLAELIAHAEKNGQITGINTNGRRLRDVGYLQELVAAGLDHVQITLESHDPQIHNKMVGAHGAWDDTVAGLKNALATGLYVMTNSTLLQDNSAMLAETLDFLAGLGVPTVGLNALIYSGRGLTVGTGLAEDSLPPLLELARQKTRQNDQRLIWYTPTAYCHFDPVQMELGVKGCSAALYNMCIEPDGSVIPCQSYYQSLGYLLDEPWDSIWNHQLAVSLRERRNLPDKCITCSFTAECGGGCPLALVDPNPEVLFPESLQTGGREDLK
jgi:radical SAM protein with 4Fe4S-binding SPASM domain